MGTIRRDDYWRVKTPQGYRHVPFEEMETRHLLAILKYPLKKKTKDRIVDVLVKRQERCK